MKGKTNDALVRFDVEAIIVFCVAWEKKCLQELRSFKRHKEVCGGCLHNQRGLVQTADVDGLLLVFKN
jgi:hypothetical protein